MRVRREDEATRSARKGGRGRLEVDMLEVRLSRHEDAEQAEVAEGVEHREEDVEGGLAIFGRRSLGPCEPVC